MENERQLVASPGQFNLDIHLLLVAQVIPTFLLLPT